MSTYQLQTVLDRIDIVEEKINETNYSKNKTSNYLAQLD